MTPHRARPLLGAGTAALVLLALTGCASAGAARASATPSGTSGGASGRAVDLLPTVWHVHDAAGAGDGTYLLFSEHRIDVLEPRGDVSAEWATQGDEMLALVDSWSMTLGTVRQPTVPWLTGATRFERSGTGWALLDVRSRVLARLADDGPAPTPTPADYGTTPDPVTSSTRSDLADAVLGPAAGLGGGSLVGRWGVPGIDVAHASLTFSKDGTWTLDGGCPSGLGDLGGSGSYRVLPSGALLQTDRPIAGVGCEPVLAHPPADAAALLRFPDARSVALDGDRLTLFDRTGERIGALTREP